MINTNAPIRGIPTGDGGTAGKYSFKKEGINFLTKEIGGYTTDCQGECGGTCICGKKG